MLQSPRLAFADRMQQGSSRLDTSRLTVRPLGRTLGAEVAGVGLGRLSSEEFAQIRRAFLDHLVLVFRGQRVTPLQQVAFTARFGRVEPHPLSSRPGHKDHPAVLVLENRPGKPGARNDFWHSDITFAEKPPMCSVLHALEVTPGRGDTLFCNMYAAYENLPAQIKSAIGGLRAVHTSLPLAERNKEAGSDALPIREVPPPVEHPVVRIHPETGRKAIFVNPYFTSHIAGVSTERSRELLDALQAEATKSENVYRHRWQRGDVVMWDNRCAMHYGVYDYDDSMPRRMHRTTAAGDRPAASASAPRNLCDASLSLRNRFL